jgi:hypothetical protein
MKKVIITIIIISVTIIPHYTTLSHHSIHLPPYQIICAPTKLTQEDDDNLTTNLYPAQ